MPLLCLLLPQIFRQEALHSALPHLHGYCGSGSMVQKRKRKLFFLVKVALCTEREMWTRRNQLLFQRRTSGFHKPRENLAHRFFFNLKEPQIMKCILCLLLCSEVCIILHFFSYTEPREYSEISHVGVEGLPDSSINCHRTLNSAYSASVVGSLQQTDR